MQNNLRAMDSKQHISILILLCVFLISLIANDLSAQSTATIYTPNGTSVTALIFTEFSQSQIASINAQAAIEYPSAQVIGDASRKYNCHAYAWYLRECTNCPKYWINTPEDDKYWADGSYEETDPCFGTKISYASDDHSAVKSIVSGKFDSKWGQYPLMRHAPTYTPYNSTTLKYYIRPFAITGPSVVCSSGSQYTLEDSPAGATVTWSSSNPNGLNINPATGVATRQNNFNGQVTITATINSACGTHNVQKNVYVGNYRPIGTSSYNSNCSGNTFNILNTSLSSACTANTPVYFSYKITDPNYSNFVYTPVSVPSGASWSHSGGTLHMTVTTPPSQGMRSATIALSATGPCGTYNVNFTSTAVNFYSSFFSMSPNPSTEDVTVSVDRENLLSDGSQNLIYAIKITDPFGTRGESFEYKAGINSVKISLHDFSSGLYVLSVFDGKMWSSEQLVIQK